MQAEQSSVPLKNRDLNNSAIVVALVAITLLAIVVIVLYLSNRVAPQPPLASEHYFPMTRGASFTYRVTHPDGSITYRSRNIQRQSANAVAAKLELGIFSALIRGAKLDVTKTDTS